MSDLVQGKGIIKTEEDNTFISSFGIPFLILVNEPNHLLLQFRIEHINKMFGHQNEFQQNVLFKISARFKTDMGSFNVGSNLLQVKFTK